MSQKNHRQKQRQEPEQCQAAHNYYNDEVEDSRLSQPQLELKSREISSIVFGISQILNTGLTQDMLDICIKLLESGFHPQALAEIVIHIRQELAQLTGTHKENVFEKN